MNDAIILNASEKAVIIMNENIKKQNLLTEEIISYRKKFVSKSEDYKKINMTERLELERSFTLEQYRLNIITKEKQLKNTEYLIERCKVYLKHLSATLNNKHLVKKTSLYEFADIVVKQSRNYYDESIAEIKQKIMLYKKFEDLLNYLQINSKKDFLKFNHLMISKEELEKLLNQQEILENERKVLIETFINKGFSIKEDDILTTSLLDDNIMNVVEKMYPNFKDEKVEEKRIS